jgi:hypothetical protein
MTLLIAILLLVHMDLLAFLPYVCVIWALHIVVNYYED